MPATAKRPATQQERSHATRTRLLNATFECLVELGYARTSTPEVLKRSGLSRGAMLHHYPTRADLLAATIEHVFARTLVEYQRTFEKLAETNEKAASAIELLWETLSGPTYYAWLELVVAARTDPQLKRKLQDVDRRFDVQVKAVRERLFPPPAEPNPMYDIAPQFAFATLKGLSVSNIYEDPDRIRQVIEPLKQLAQLADSLSSGQRE